MALTLPYPDLVFVPLDILTAEEQNEIVANYTYISNQFPIGANNIDFTTFEYSTEEKAVGKWIDGKIIYRKTFVNTFSGAENAFDVSSLNIDLLIDWKNTVIHSNSQHIVGFRLGTDASTAYKMMAVQFRKQEGTLTFDFGTIYQNNKTVYTTLLYTKN